MRDDRNRELFDLPDGPRPDPDTPAPVRLLPEFDNVLLSHADRSRFGVGDDVLRAAKGPVKGTVLVDGMVAAVWHSVVDRDRSRAELVIEHAQLSARVRRTVEAEARRAARFWHPTAAEHEVRLLVLD